MYPYLAFLLGKKRDFQGYFRQFFHLSPGIGIGSILGKHQYQYQYLEGHQGQYQYQYQYLENWNFNTNTNTGLKVNTSIPIPGIADVCYVPEKGGRFYMQLDPHWFEHLGFE